MEKRRKKFSSVIVLSLYLFGVGFISPSFSLDSKYPDYAYEFLGVDKYENYNRKMFGFNQRLNKYVIRPIHVTWASIMPQYGMDRLLGISNNIEYPIRFTSCLVQGDFRAAGRESIRFLVNSTIGLAGMFDPAKRYLNIEQVNENMDQALAKMKIKSKRFFVLPVISFTTYRGVAGKILDTALNPTTYIGTPALAAVKAGLAINRTSYFQALIKMLETNYADPYEFYKAAYGIDMYAKQNNFDRVEVISQLNTDYETIKKKHKKRRKEKVKLDVSAQIADVSENDLSEFQEIEFLEEIETIIKMPIYKEEKKEKIIQKKPTIIADIECVDYKPQSPVVDSMRTGLFYLPDSDKSIWNEMSIWNKSFKNKIKVSNINLVKGKDDYTFKYLLQKDKSAPLAIIYPSIGEGVTSSHPVMFAKIFYDSGYSVLILGNPFQWEFVKSMDDNYRPGVPLYDAIALRNATIKAIEKVEKKHNREFKNKVIIGTSYAAITSLFMANLENKEHMLGNLRFIAICPPIDLMYAMKQVDANYDSQDFESADFKNMVARMAAKIVKLYQAKSKKEIDFEVNQLPFDEDEAKLLTGFIMHQKLSDVIFILDKAPKNKKSDIYKKTNNMGFSEYMQEYLVTGNKELDKKMLENTKLTSISSYLKNENNYKIYHSTNDYLINEAQLKALKQISKDKLVILDNGAHLGFLYRHEFISDLYKAINEMKEESNL